MYLQSTHEVHGGGSSSEDDTIESFLNTLTCAKEQKSGHGHARETRLTKTKASCWILCKVRR